MTKSRFIRFVKMVSLIWRNSFLKETNSKSSHRFAVESDCRPLLVEDVLLDPVEDRGLPAVVES